MELDHLPSRINREEALGSEEESISVLMDLPNTCHRTNTDPNQGQKAARRFGQKPITKAGWKAYRGSNPGRGGWEDEQILAGRFGIRVFALQRFSRAMLLDMMLVVMSNYEPSPSEMSAAIDGILTHR